MLSFFEKLRSVFTLTFITSVLYFCGYLSSDYYTRVLGIRINYDALDIIKWGADFFLYSVIGFFANWRTLGADWLRYDFLVVICLDIIILFSSWYLSKNAKRGPGFLQSLQEKCKLTHWSFLFCGVTVILSIHYLSFFLGRTDLEYKRIMKLGNLFVVYSFFIVLNILNIVNIRLSHWKSDSGKRIKYFLIIPLLFLPALYGVYGRNYNFNCVHQNYLETSLLLESHKGKNYLLERRYNCDVSEMISNHCDDVHYQYKIVDDEDYVLTVEKLNFFDFILDRYNENSDDENDE